MQVGTMLHVNIDQLTLTSRTKTLGTNISFFCVCVLSKSIVLLCDLISHVLKTVTNYGINYLKFNSNSTLSIMHVNL